MEGRRSADARRPAASSADHVQTAWSHSQPNAKSAAKTAAKLRPKLRSLWRGGRRDAPVNLGRGPSWLQDTWTIPYFTYPSERRHSRSSGSRESPTAIGGAFWPWLATVSGARSSGPPPSTREAPAPAFPSPPAHPAGGGVEV